MKDKRDKALNKSIMNAVKIEINGCKYVIKRSTFRKLAFAFVFIISLLTNITSNIIGNVSDQIKLSNYTAPQRNIVASQTHPTEDGKNFWYDNHDIAKYLLEEGPENFDENLYGVYYNIGYNDDNKIKMTNEILGIMNDITTYHPEYGFENGYENFDDYLTANGFVDGDGKPSIKRYKAYMETITVAKADSKTEDFSMK